MVLHEIDRLENQYLAVDPFVQLFTAFNQAAGTLAILSIPASMGLVYFFPNQFGVEGGLFLIEQVLLCALLFMALNALVDMVNLATGVFLTGFFTLNTMFFLTVVLEPGSRILSRYLTGACLMYVCWRTGATAVSIFRMSPADRAVVKSLPGGITIAGKIWRRLHLVPPLFEFIGIGPRKLLIGLLAQISSLSVATAVVLVYLVPMSGFIPLFVVPAILLIIILFAIGGALQRFVRQMLRFSLEQLQRVDPRPPVLFLRAFKDDQIELRPANLTFLGWVLRFGYRRTNLDHLLLEEGTPYGPIVAIGNPDDKLPPYGAARGYFDDKTWQQAVSNLAREASGIVLCVDNTEGIFWEINHLAKSNLLNKTLFLIHPRHAEQKQNLSMVQGVFSVLRYDPSEIVALLQPRPFTPALPPEVAAKLKQLPMQVAANSPPQLSVIGFFLASDGQMQVAVSSTLSSTAHLLTLRLFLRSKLGLKTIPLRRK